jgi:hypothetical protein
VTSASRAILTCGLELHNGFDLDANIARETVGPDLYEGGGGISLTLFSSIWRIDTGSGKGTAGE